MHDGPSGRRNTEEDRAGVGGKMEREGRQRRHGGRQLAMQERRGQRQRCFELIVVLLEKGGERMEDVLLPEWAAEEHFKQEVKNNVRPPRVVFKIAVTK